MLWLVVLLPWCLEFFAEDARDVADLQVVECFEFACCCVRKRRKFFVLEFVWDADKAVDAVECFSAAFLRVREHASDGSADEAVGHFLQEWSFERIAAVLALQV